MTPADIARLRELLARATPGPWVPKHAKTVFLDGGAEHEIRGPRGVTIARLYNSGDDARQETNTSLIAAAVNSLPDLLALVEAQREALENVHEALRAVHVFPNTRPLASAALAVVRAALGEGGP